MKGTVKIWIGWIVNYDSHDSDPYIYVGFDKEEILVGMCNYMIDWYDIFDEIDDPDLGQLASEIILLHNDDKIVDCWETILEYHEDRGNYISWDYFHTLRHPPNDGSWWGVWLADD